MIAELQQAAREAMGIAIGLFLSFLVVAIIYYSLSIYFNLKQND